MIILIFFANLSEERPINGGKEVEPLSGFGAIIQTEQSTVGYTVIKMKLQFHEILPLS